MSSVEPRVRTLSLEERSDLTVAEPVATTSASGWSVGKADSFATVAGRLSTPGGMAPSFFRRPVVKKPRSAIAVTLKGGESLSLEQVQELDKRAHTGGPNGGPDISAVSRMRHLVAAAHAARQGGGGVMTPVQDWVLKNWRVPEGVEKSGERVTRQ